MGAVTTLQDFAAFFGDPSKRIIAIPDLMYSATLAGNLTLTSDYPSILRLDPGGSSRDVTWEAEANSEGVLRLIVNAADAAENLVIKDDGGSTIATVNEGDSALMYCDGTSLVLAAMFTTPVS